MRIIYYLYFMEWFDYGVLQDFKYFFGKYFFVCLFYYLDVFFVVDRMEEKWFLFFCSVKIILDRYVEVVV